MARLVRLTVVAILLVALGAAALATTGCPGRQQVNPNVGTRTLTAADAPLKSGSFKGYFSNNPKVNPFVPVDFDTSGPWDFSDGPIDALIVAIRMPAKSGLDAASFPKATVAQLLAVKGQEPTGTYSFYSENSSAYLGYGQANRIQGTNVFSRPERILAFPVKVGSEWTDQITLNSTPPSKLEIKRKALGQNTIKVPAGTFKDAMMIRVVRTITQSDGSTANSTVYEWYAPKVGLVAAIAGRKDEPSPMFKEAAFFQRLKTYTK